MNAHHTQKGIITAIATIVIINIYCIEVENPLMKFAIAFLFLLPLAGQDKQPADPIGPPGQKGETLPTVPLEHQRDYYRADGRVQRATKAVEEAQKLLETANAELREAGNVIITDCGTGHLPSEDPGKKSLVCAAKPKP